MTYILLFSLFIFAPALYCNQHDSQDNRPVVLSPVLPIVDFEQTSHAQQTSVHILNAGDSRNQSCGHNSVSSRVPQPIPISQAQYLRSLPSAVMLSKGHRACQNWDIRNYAQALVEQQIGTVMQRNSPVDGLYPWFSTNNATLCFSDHDLQKIFGMLHLYGYPHFLLTLKTMPRFHDYMPAVAAALQSGNYHKSVSKDAKKGAQRLAEQASRERSEQIAAQKTTREIGGMEDHDRPEAVADDYDIMPECIQEAWKKRHAIQCAQEESQDFRYQEYALSDVFAEFLNDMNKNCGLLKHQYGTALQHTFHKEILQIGDLAARTGRYEELEIFQFSQMLATALTCNEKSQHRLTGAALDYCLAVTEALNKWPGEYWNKRFMEESGKVIDKITGTIKSAWEKRKSGEPYAHIGKGILRGIKSFGNMIAHPVQTAMDAVGVISYVAVKFCLNAGIIAATTALRGPLAGIEVAKQASFDFRDLEIEVFEKMTSMSDEEFLEVSCALGTETVLTLGSGHVLGAALESLTSVDAATIAKSADTSKGFFNHVRSFFKDLFSSDQPDAFAIIEGADSVAIQAGMLLGGVEVIEISQSITVAQEAASKAKGVVLATAEATAVAKARATAAGGSGLGKNIPIKDHIFSDENLFEELLKLKKDYHNLANKGDLPFDKVFHRKTIKACICI